MPISNLVRAVLGYTPTGPNVEQDKLLKELNNRMKKAEDASKAKGLSFIPKGDIRIQSDK